MAEENAVVPVEEQPPATKPATRSITFVAGKGIELHNLEQALGYATSCFNSRMLPEHIKTPQQAFAILSRGAELGLPAWASWRFIYPTKQGKLAIESKGALAVVQASAVFGSYVERIENEDGKPETWRAVAIATRRGAEPTIKTFSYQDAQAAGLLKERRNREGSSYDGPWQSFLKDMLLSKARSRALDVAFADVLGGIPTREEAETIEEMEARARGRTGAGTSFALPPAPPPRDPLLAELARPAVAPAALEPPGPPPATLADLSASQPDPADSAGPPDEEGQPTLFPSARKPHVEEDAGGRPLRRGK